tara:strand:+ start:2139 stop:4523 length:2385 start_codon:yes stop_codon:yes gene_type:complete
MNIKNTNLLIIVIMKLVIVESPAKCSKIQGFLGDDYKVCASYGHIRDLIKGLNAIDINNNYQPKYRITKHDVVRKLRNISSQAEEVIIASDMDREGEAIGFHIASVLKLCPKKTKRIVFNQITKSAIKTAIQNPRLLNVKLFNAQQARRIMDRLIGFTISPILWRCLASKLSAGRCQSPALGIVYDRETEIKKFTSVTKFSIHAVFEINNNKYDATFTHTYINEKDTVTFLNRCIKAYFEIGQIKYSPILSRSPPPFTTSTLQQAASSKGIFPKECMRLAQKLYEAGLITYMRTDSITLSQSCHKQCETYINNKFNGYHCYRSFGKKKGSQNAHEAIRPVKISCDSLESKWSSRASILYSLIWKRTVASQMKPKETTRCTYIFDMFDINPKNNEFIESVEKARCDMFRIDFDGWCVLYSGESNSNLNQWNVLNCNKLPIECSLTEISGKQLYDSPPSRYSQAQLIKQMEKHGIGRPSTFSSIITTIIDNNYVNMEECAGQEKSVVELIGVKNKKLKDFVINRSIKTMYVGKEKKRLHITDIGNAIVEFLKENFPIIMRYTYTSKMEVILDEIAKGNAVWSSCVDNMYDDIKNCIVNLKKNQTVCSKSSKFSDNKMFIGNHPNSNKPIYVFIGKKGKVIQHGDKDDPNVTFSVWKTRKKLENIKVSDDLLNHIPIDMGEYNGKHIIIANGPYGKYIQWGDNKISLQKPLNTLDEYVKYIETSLQNKKLNQRIVHGKGKNALYVCNGPYGFYIRKGKTIRSLPSTEDWQQITKEECEKILQQPKSRKKWNKKKKKL